MFEINKLLLSNRTKLIAQTYKNWITRGSKVLDVGCGDGFVTSQLAKEFQLKITGADIDNYLSYKIPFVLMKKPDILPFPDKSFDSVLFNDVLHHTDFKIQERLLLESIRLARKNVLIAELEPTLAAYLGDYILNKIYHPAMIVPFKYRKLEKWLKLFNRLPVRVERKNVHRPFFSPFSRLAFCLKIK